MGNENTGWRVASDVLPRLRAAIERER